MRRFAAAYPVLACVAAVACPGAHDTTPLIAVDPKAAGRWSAIVDQGIRPSRAHVMEDGEQLGGPNAIGRPGDILLENDQIAIVIDRLGSSAGFAETGGNIVDAADARLRKDELGQMFTYFGKFPRQGVYDSLTKASDDDGTAWVEASGRELYEPMVRVATRYTLRPTGRALLIRTTLQNTGADAVTLPGLGDAVEWGGAEKFAPGKSRGFKGASKGAYVAGVGRFTSYAVTSATAGELDAVSGGGWTDALERTDVRLGPGESTSYERMLIVGARADTSSLLSQFALMADQKVGEISVALLPAPGETALAVSADARLSVRDATGVEKLTIHAAGDPPRLDAELPVGRYALAYSGGAGRTGVSPVAVDVAPDARTHAELVVSDPASVRVECLAGNPSGPIAVPDLDVRRNGGSRSRMPCKLTFERTDGGPVPDFGPAYVAGPARNQATTADGLLEVPLAAGSYSVTASRGPEYALDHVNVVLAPGDRKEISLSLTRVVDTTGYLACDFHQHTMLGTDAPVATRDRMVANAAEGVEVAVASEHNVIADLEPIVRELHLEREVISIPGDELTSDASRHGWGHANVWPLSVDDASPRGGAPGVRDRSPRELFEALRRTSSVPIVVQLNHPRSGTTGYFDQTGFDRTSGVGTSPGYDATFDALEVWNGRNVEARAKVLADFLALLRTSHPVTATADTDTHGIVGQEAGYPRTYVRVEDDGPPEPWNEARSRDLVRGVRELRDVVLTNGPMLRVTANGAPIGGVARGRVVAVNVHVESAPWVLVDEVALLRATQARGDAGVAAPETSETQEIAPKLNPRGALAADLVFTVPVSGDDAIVVIASGHRSMAPVVAAGGSPEEIAPWAMTGAIWIDADGDGHSLGR